MGEEKFQLVLEQIVRQCINKGLVNGKRPLSVRRKKTVAVPFGARDIPGALPQLLPKRTPVIQEGIAKKTNILTMITTIIESKNRRKIYAAINSL